MHLRDLALEKSYDSEQDNILEDFYNPVLSCAVRYDRITGFFSPKVFALAARGFRTCLKNNCKIRIITSVEIEPEAYDALTETSKEQIVEEAIENFNPDSLIDDLPNHYLDLFMYLYKTGQLELKIALVDKTYGIMHEKVGVIYDEKGDAIAFSGSNNETASGWANNIEEFLVFSSWEPNGQEYFNTRINKFENFWSGKTKRFRIADVNEINKKALIKKVNNDEFSKEELVERIKKLEQNSDITVTSKSRRIRSYQREAIEHWRNENYVSIFAMATGTGKTFTALSALDAFTKEQPLRCVIAVPLISLVSQWHNEVTNFFPDVTTICACSSIDSGWKEKIGDLKLDALYGVDTNFVIITTYDTLASQYFMETIPKISSQIVLLADEMHNLIVENRRRIKAASLDCYKFRLGLSATPTRLWASEESKLVAKIFGNNPFVYDLAKAIEAGFLVPFYYHPIPAALDYEEYQEYLSLSRKIAQLSEMDKNGDKEAHDNLIKIMLIRADIKKNAASKIPLLCSELGTLQAENLLKQTLIYADDGDQLRGIQMNLTDMHVKTAKFTGEVDIAERESIINGLRTGQHDAIVAIKCLDEGVDIPSARTSFILASSTDPREYVQRLGRVLRLDPAGNKRFANVYDFIITPPPNVFFEDEIERKFARNLIKNELIRAKFFVGLCADSDEARSTLDEISQSFGFVIPDSELCYNNDKESSKE